MTDEMKEIVCELLQRALNEANDNVCRNKHEQRHRDTDGDHDMWLEGWRRRHRKLVESLAYVNND